MTNLSQLLEDAEKYNASKANLDVYKDVIAKLRTKGASWREIAKFLSEKAGIKVEHTKIARTAISWGLETNLAKDLPSSKEYVKALRLMSLSNDEKTMLLYHFNQHNRTVTYSDLSSCLGHDSYQYANKLYGGFSKKLCEQLNFKAIPSASGRPFYGSVVGMRYAYSGPKDEFQLVMHHELSKAIEELRLEDNMFE